MKRIERAELRRIIRLGHRLDASGYVLSSKPRALVHGPILPPYELGSDQTRMDGLPSDLPVEQFELLSLAARSTMAGTSYEGLPFRARHPTDLAECFPVINVEELLDVVAEAASFLELIGADRANAQVAAQRARFLAGVQIVGCRITAQDWNEQERRFEGEELSLLLANARLPFSLRFIGCVINSPIVANHCMLQTLDLSGSAVAGVDASFLQTRGSVRLRRATILSPANFAGARISGVFDASDSVMQPRMPVPRRQPFTAERGMLNLGQARLDNDVYLNRSRIWGGLNLRGATIDRSLFMNLAVIRSPVAIIERLMCEQIRPHFDKEDLPESQEAALELDRLIEQRVEVANLIHRRADPREGRHQALIKAEAIGSESWPAGSDESDATRTFVQLLSDSMRARTSAIRGDSLNVRGNIFARSMKAAGRVRLNYAVVGGGLHLEGAELRSVAAVGRILDFIHWIATSKLRSGTQRTSIVELDQLRTTTRKEARETEIEKDDDYALDLRQSTFGGSVVVTNHRGRGPNRQATRLDGVLAADRVSIEGDLILRRLDVTFPPKRCYDDNKREELRSSDDGAKLARDWAHRRTWEEHQPLDWELSGRDASTLRLHQATVDGDIDLREATNLYGVDLENARVGGSLLFSDHFRAPSESELSKCRTSIEKTRLQESLVLERRAYKVQKEVNLRSAQIGGDATLLFSPTGGPNLKAELARVAGRLDIYPQIEMVPDPLAVVDGQTWLSYAAFRAATYEARRARGERRLAQKQDPYAAPPKESFIDLRDAKAGVICHPPPAWPRQDGLSIMGFDYERSTPYGPLAPHPYPDNDAKLSELRESIGLWGLMIQRRDKLFDGLVMATPLLLVVIWWLACSEMARQAYEGAYAVVANTSWREYTMLAVLTALILFWQFVLRQVRPRIEQTRPMGIAYLALQRSVPNRYQTAGGIYWSLDPYARACRVLREEGRAINANEVEVARLRERTAVLSWRHHFMAKVGLYLVQFLANYGFNISRTAVVLAYVVIFAAMTAHAAEVCHALAPVDAGKAAVEQRNDGRNGQFTPQRAPPSPPAAKSGVAAAAPPAEPPMFDSFWYGVDVVIPFVDFEETKAWRPRYSPQTCSGVMFPRWLARTWKPMFTVLGLLLTSIGMAALATRAESAFRRVEE